MRAMRLPALLALLALPSAACTLYFGSDEPVPTDPRDPRAPDKPPGEDPTDPGPVEPPKPQCGTPEVHILSVYETSSNHSTAGNAAVTIERPGDHILVLSAYESTNWHVQLAPGAKVRGVHLIGYEPQSVDLPNIPVTRDSGCGYSYPYNGGGCDTNVLFERVEARANAGITTFHGCYQASQWTLHADGTAASNCNTAAGYEVDELISKCDGGGGGGSKYTWEKASFMTLTPPSCTGERYLRRDDHYGVWVGAILCSGTNQYKLYMGATRTDRFLEVADFAGHGQDHCELANRSFKIPDEDDITSGGCTTCAVGQLVDVDGPPVYARANFGQPFQRVQSRYWADLTTTFYSCGVSIP